MPDHDDLSEIDDIALTINRYSSRGLKSRLP
jgi:hypothetical protein